MFIALKLSLAIKSLLFSANFSFFIQSNFGASAFGPPYLVVFPFAVSLCFVLFAVVYWPSPLAIFCSSWSLRVEKVVWNFAIDSEEGVRHVEVSAVFDVVDGRVRLPGPAAPEHSC